MNRDTIPVRPPKWPGGEVKEVKMEWRRMTIRTIHGERIDLAPGVTQGAEFIAEPKTPKRRGHRGRFEIEDEGGTYVDSKGYPAMCAGPLRGWRIHRLVAMAKFGIDAVQAKDVVIHHRDGNKLNPHPENLELMDERKHNAVTAKQYWYLKKNVWPKERAAWKEYFAAAPPRRGNA